MDCLLNVTRRHGVPRVVASLNADLHVDPLQGPQALAHPRVGLGLGHGLSPAVTCVSTTAAQSHAHPLTVVPTG